MMRSTWEVHVDMYIVDVSVLVDLVKAIYPIWFVNTTTTRRIYKVGMEKGSPPSTYTFGELLVSLCITLIGYGPTHAKCASLRS